ncbi:hypothetical protein Pmar_PMAR017180 [Perkinsus marinus ATCC 50983]|uniref:Uncharacterized protein n=1 Tax=Perkinsus marinus (strain ATCC 50983 / TXsc) TaxID=423536 RepID=C5LST0_PERM5|nr:hypothetical protein Pmar_PMAR017180 [Perkinsus marinus ATCC 50983]EER00321.1 hypothetical protein Pmar_PMAR017180 [Perkinsus marinus ATCC 50983]|eukprot:XP_002767603.1 hypothetical protein Pmar_PMAR017180 [Perkinsus marinus ATCC 50983]
MAMAWNSAVVPAFGSNRRPNPLYPNGLAYARQREAELRELHLRRILSRVRGFRFGKLKQAYKDAGREEEEIKSLMKMPRRLEVEQERASLVGKLHASKYRRWEGMEAMGVSRRQQRRHTAAALEAAEMLDPIIDEDEVEEEELFGVDDDETLLGEDAVEGATEMAEAIAFDESKYSAAPLKKSRVAASLKELLNDDNDEAIPSLSTLREMYGVGKSNPFVGNPFEGNKPDSDKAEQWEVEDFEREMSDQVIGKPTLKPKYDYTSSE